MTKQGQSEFSPRMVYRSQGKMCSFSPGVAGVCSVAGGLPHPRESISQDGAMKRQRKTLVPSLEALFEVFLLWILPALSHLLRLI